MSDTKICVRLNGKANLELEKMMQSGLTKSQCINSLLENAAENSRVLQNSISTDYMIHFAAIQNELEFLEDESSKENIRKELNALCRALRLYPTDM